ncbi:HK97 gp10 family phage protein [Paenibacillus sp. FSL R5-0908]|uniref:HK97 gp10 family phage protein n=1 Tax=Paenibacillus sp. FSL R5-0908 TaxID=2921664 RepID=UPI0030F6BF1D
MAAEFRIDNLEKWQQWLAELASGPEMDATKDRITRKAGMLLLESLDDLTPVRTGWLRESMQLGHPQNVFQIEVGRTTHVFVGTAVSYAGAVNDGYTQKRGRYVPGYWKRGNFIYVPYEEAKAQGIGGMVLTGQIIPGAHMFEKAMDRLEEDMPELLEVEFKRLFDRLF